LRQQANWELVVKLVLNIPGKDEDVIIPLPREFFQYSIKTASIVFKTGIWARKLIFMDSVDKPHDK